MLNDTFILQLTTKQQKSKGENAIKNIHKICTLVVAENMTGGWRMMITNSGQTTEIRNN